MHLGLVDLSQAPCGTFFGRSILSWKYGTNIDRGILYLQGTQVVEKGFNQTWVGALRLNSTWLNWIDVDRQFPIASFLDNEATDGSVAAAKWHAARDAPIPATPAHARTRRTRARARLALPAAAATLPAALPLGAAQGTLTAI